MFGWRSRRKRERDLADELGSHLEMAARDRSARGEDEKTAGLRARRELGNLGLIAEATRATWGGLWRERIAQDVGYAVRMMRRNPGFSAVAIGTIALGIGANTAVFSVIKAALFSPEPYRQPDRLVVLKQIVLGDRVNTSAAEFLDFKRRSRVFEESAGYQSEEYDLTGTQEPERVSGVRITSGLFRTLGVGPALGRGFSAQQDFAGGTREAVVSDGFALTHFGDAHAAISRTIRLNEETYLITGVMPAGFEFPASRSSNGEAAPALWVPMAFQKDELVDRAASYDISFIARLKSDISLGDAQKDVTRVSTEFQRELPDVYRGGFDTRVLLEPLGEETMTRRRPALVLLACGVVLVLLIACANLSNLLLARAGAREREMAARSALGAGAGRLVVQLVLETLTLTISGGLLGSGFAWAGTRAALKLAPTRALIPPNVSVDARVLLFSVLLSLATGLVCALAPALAFLRTNSGDALKQSGRSATASRAAQRLRNGLVILEAALSIVLLIGAALLIRSFAAVLATPLGFDPHGVTIVRTSFNRHRYSDAARRHNAEREIVKRLRLMPGIDQASLTTHIPIADEREIGFVVEGRDPNEFHWADNSNVDAAYFGTMRIPLRNGRTFDDRDSAMGPRTAIINETMARQFWPHADAMGKRFFWGGGNAKPFTVIGVAGDVHLESLDLAPRPTIYMPVYQSTLTDAVFVLRTPGQAPASMGAQARKIIWSVDPGLPVFETASMQSIVDRSLAARRFTMFVLATFAGLALLLASIGLYGVLAYMVAQRTRELGVRLALGANPTRLLIETAGSGIRLAIAGLLFGVAAGALLASGMSRLLFGVEPLDPVSFASAAGSLLIAAVCAATIPALRASRVDPLTALRCE